MVTAPGGGSIPLTVTSEYGNRSTVTVHSGEPYGLAISDAVTYVTYPVGDTLSVGPTESYGSNLALTSAGATATATSGNATSAIDGLQTGDDQGWSSVAGDTSPSMTVTLQGEPTIDRIVVDTQSVGSTASGLRDYALSVDEPGTGWTTVANVVGEFRAHEQLVAIGPVQATAVRITVSEVNFGGYYGGGIPPWWSPTLPATAFLHALQVYAGSDTPGQVNGSSLSPL